MGGPGSGNWCRFGKGTTEESNGVDIRYMKKRGFLRPGTYGTLGWTCGGEPSGSIRFNTCSDYVQLIYRSRSYGSDWEDMDYPVYFDETDCHYGGTRKWFLCPGQGCGKRVAVLYGAGKYFLCRHCHDLAYASQSENAALRASRKSNKIIERLGGDISFGYADKPKWMHWKTYNRLMREAEYYENLSWAYMGDWLNQLRAGVG